MLRKELGEWFSTRRWLVHLLTWVAIINGVVALVMVADDSEDALQVFVLLGVFASAMGVVVATQGSVVGEKQRGTAAWMLSKPVTRTSFLLAKMIGHGVGFTVLACLAPCAVFVLEAALLGTGPPSLPALAAAAALWTLHLLVYVALGVALGAAFPARGPVAAIGTGLLLAGQFFGGMVPVPVLTFLPWVLPKAADAVAHGDPLPTSLPTVVAAAAVLIVASAAFGLWRLHRQEL
jgi:ABC-2 type transport system permease protein